MINFAITTRAFQLMDNKENWEEFEKEEMVIVDMEKWHVYISKYLGGYKYKIGRDKFDKFFEILE